MSDGAAPDPAGTSDLGERGQPGYLPGETVVKRFTSGSADRGKTSPHEQVAIAVREGYFAGGGFFSSIMAGFLIGFVLDRWLGTDPWLVVAGIVLGSVNGFYRMHEFAKAQEAREMQRRGR
jgi:ATP synthase protein I